MAKRKQFNIFAFNKAIVALIMASVAFINVFWTIPVPVDEETITLIVAAITPILVYFVPNK